MVSYCGSQQWDEQIIFPHAYILVSIKSGIVLGVVNDICLKGDDMLLKTFEFFCKEFEWFICIWNYGWYGATQMMQCQSWINMLAMIWITACSYQTWLYTNDQCLRNLSLLFFFLLHMSEIHATYLEIVFYSGCYH